jgi:C4-dicarboxylate-specific signal transduction histidine kinase
MKHLYRLFFPPAWSIAAKISLALLSAVLIPMSFNAYYNLQHSLSNAEQSEYRQLELLATSTASRLDQLIIDNQKVVSQVSTEPNILDFIGANTVKKRQKLQSAVQSTLNNILRSNKNYDAIFLIDRKGKCLASTNSNFVNRNFSSQEYFREAIQGNNYASDLIADSTTKKSGFYLSQTIWSSQGKIIGIAVLKIKQDNINEIVDRLKLESGSYAFLVDSLGVIINHPEKDYIYHSLTTLSPEVQTKIAKDRRYPISQVESLDLPELAEAMIGSREPDYANYFFPLRDSRQIVGFAPLEVQQWVIGISKPETAFVKPLNSLIWENILNLIIVGAIAAAFALLLARSISRPIRKLTKTAKCLEQGNFECDRLLSISHSQDDIGQLVRVFIHMAQEVESRENKLKQKVQKLNIEVDRAKKERQVEEVTGTKYFQQLQLRAKKLKQRNNLSDHNWQEHFQQLQKKAQKIRIRALTSS